MTGLNEGIKSYGAWRAELSGVLERYERWLGDNDLSDAALRARIKRMQERLRDERMSIAFVAEFSRGKSELINALFFADYRQRVLPSSAGRTTMCPTEIAWDPALPPGIRLLPIETRLRDASIAELRRFPGEWRTVPFDPQDVGSIKQAFEAVRETKLVSAEAAMLMGLYDATEPEILDAADDEAVVEVSCWRHALVNIPHPLLENGLVLIDTPGLNAIGSEPELTLNLIPSAHAVLFVLAADTGVTRSDLAVWRQHIDPAHRAGRFVVLNKIDGLWDELKSGEEIEREIEEQVAEVAHQLHMPRQRVFALSAQKGLVAKVQGNAELLARSRITRLERALSREIIPQKQVIVREHIRRELEDAYAITQGLLGARQRNVLDQVVELDALRGRNRGAIDVMARRVRAERAEFERSLKQLAALRAVHGRERDAILGAASIDRLRHHVRIARQQMRDSRLSSGLREAMAGLIAGVRGDFERIRVHVDEVNALMSAMYETFHREFGLQLGEPTVFSGRRFVEEIVVLDEMHQRHFGALTLLTLEKWALTRRFFESIVARFRDLYEAAGRDLDAWLRAVFVPVEAQVHEHQLQLRRRMDSVRRITHASGELESRITELQAMRERVEQQLDGLRVVRADVDQVLERMPGGTSVAPVAG